MNITSETDARAFLRQLADAAISAADPADVLQADLPEKPNGRCIVVGAGKSAAAMARAVELAWPDVDLSGVVVTRYGHAVPTSRIKVREAAHPVPDLNGQKATTEILEAVSAAREGDLVLALISGGGSALLTAPTPPLTLDDKIDVTKRLLASGLPIAEMNQLRRRLSLVKGGGLARAAAPARLVTLAISDVPGDEPMAIASGPTVPVEETGIDLTRAIERLGPGLSDRVLAALSGSATDDAAPPAGDYRLIATPQMSLAGAARLSERLGVTPVILGDALEGEAKEMGTVMAGVARAVVHHGTPARRPAVLISGGETTVTIGDRPFGRGGRNTEFLLSLAIALKGMPGVHAVAVDTDGIDGTEDAAGAVITPTTLSRALAAGCDPGSHLSRHDSYSLFDAIGDLVRTGPTRTNVNDFRAILVR